MTALLLARIAAAIGAVVVFALILFRRWLRSGWRPRPEWYPETPAHRRRRSDAPRPEPRDDELTRTAVHEAGHAAVAWVSPLVLAVTEVAIYPGVVERRATERLGNVGISLTACPSSELSWALVAIHLAGIASELSVYPKARTKGMSSDLSRALGYAAEIVALGSPSPPWPETEERTIPFERFYADAISPEALRVLLLGYGKARQVIDAQRLLRDRLASMVLAKNTLSQADLERAFGKRDLILLCGVIRPVPFVV